MLVRFRRALLDHLVESIENAAYTDGYIDEVNSFPSIAVLNPASTLLHRGAGERIWTITALVRGYVKTEEETSIADAEFLARSIEYWTARFPRAFTHGVIVESGLILTEDLDFLVTEQLIQIAKENRLDYVEDARIVSITTDEGLFSPYGLCDLQLEMTYVTPY